MLSPPFAWSRARSDTTYAPATRGAVIVLVALLGFLVARDQFHTPSAAPASAPATAFSAGRAMDHVRAFATEPRPQGSEAAAAGRDYIVQQLEALGLAPEVQSTTTVRTTAGTDAVFGAGVVNVVARIPGSDSTGAIVLSGHYDSGPNALGAGDCGSCVATVIETARALLAGPQLRNDVILLFPDGEETQLFGSHAFVEQHPWTEDVAFALNLESQGSGGAAVFYVSSPDDEHVASKVIEYAEQPVAYAYLSTLVRNLVGGSDLDSFTDEGIEGAGVAFFESEQYYHTALDSPQRLDEGSVQHLGEYALRVVRGLGSDDLTALEGDADSIYFTLWRGFVVEYPTALVIPLALLAVVGFAVALHLGWRRGRVSPGNAARAAGLFIGVFLLALVLTGLLWALIRATNADYHVFLIGVTYDADRYVLAFALLTVALYFAAYLWASRRLGRLELAAGSLGVWSVAALLTAFVLPSFSPLFTWPLLAGLAVFAVSLARPALTEQPWANVAGAAVVVLVTMLLVAPAVLLFQTLGGRVEALSGAPMMALPVLWVALAAGLVLAFTPFPPFERAWLLPAGMAAVALVLVGWTSATSGFDADHPKPNMVIYNLDTDTGTAEWLTTADAAFGRGRSGQIDEWTSQFFGDAAEPAEVAAWSAGPEMTTAGYRAPAPTADLPPPALEVLADEAAGNTRHLTLRVTSPRGATNVRMHIDAAPSALTVDGVPADLEGLTLDDGTWLHYLALPPEGIQLELAVPAGSPPVIDVHDWSQGLPDLPGVTIEPRPAGMVPSAHDLADTTIVRQTHTLD